ncbi:MAG: MarR family transcriptional regulator [Actinomycetota bacterium]
MHEGLPGGTQRAWRAFLSANLRLMERLDHELQQRSQLSLTDYEILSALDEAPDQRLRMSELADRVIVSRSRLTYRVDRLAAAEYVSRIECEDDRRGLFASLTPTGASALAAATPGHDIDINTWFFDLLDEPEVATIESIMTRVDEKLASN